MKEIRMNKNAKKTFCGQFSGIKDGYFVRLFIVV